MSVKCERILKYQFSFKHTHGQWRKLTEAHILQFSASRHFVLQPFRTQALRTLSVSNPGPNPDLTVTVIRNPQTKY